MGSGPGPVALAHDTAFRKERLKASEFRPDGDIAGRFTVVEPTEAGEATIQTGGALQDAVRDMAEAVDRVALPLEQRGQVLRFQALLRGGAADRSQADQKAEEE